MILKNVRTGQWPLRNEGRRKTSTKRQKKRLNMFVSSAPAAGFKVHNKKGYDLSSPAVLSPWFKLRDPASGETGEEQTGGTEVSQQKTRQDRISSESKPFISHPTKDLFNC